MMAPATGSGPGSLPQPGFTVEPGPLARPGFDLYGSLPEGTTVLEASAGTGKTYTIAALATRYIAEGVADLSQLMMVTFGRMATNELRLRVRERLARSEHALSLVLSRPAGPTGPTGPNEPNEGEYPGRPDTSSELDQLDRLLSAGREPEVRTRRDRLRAALADFDAATIATTHEFCQTMLAGLGVLGEHDPDATFVESLTDLTREVAADVYLQQFASLEVPPPFDFEQACTIAAQVVDQHPARLVPDLSNARVDERAAAVVDRSTVGQRIAFGRRVRVEVERRKRRLRAYSYSDMLTGLRDCLADPESGEQAAQRLRKRYRIVLVDEFQDTDPVQWDILRRAFHRHSTLILIGDPKQAIYAFRGADVYSYLAAVTDADTVATLDTNWRSDAGLVEAQQLIMGGAALGDPRIVVRPVASAHPEPRLRLPGPSTEPGRLAPVRLRVHEPEPGSQGFPSVSQWRPEIATDLARDIAALLGSGAEIRDGDLGRDDPGGDDLGRDDLASGDFREDDQFRDDHGESDHDETREGRWRAVHPGDVAVLVRSNARLELVKAALDAVGVPAVVRGARSVFCSTVAQEWRRLLVACEQPRQAKIRDVALTSFVGWDVAALVRADDEALTDLSGKVRRWARVLSQQGVAALVEAVTEETGLAERLLNTEDGERRLTDLRHVGQNLHAAQLAGQLGVGGLLAWLTERIAEATRNQADEQSRRLETDAEAVQILTIHGSKGLEFPVVYLPEAWDRWVPDDDGQVLRLHAGPDEFGLDAGSGDSGISQHIAGPAEVGPAAPAGTVLNEVLDIGGALGPGRRDRFARAGLEEAGEDLRLYYVALTRARSQVVTWWVPSRNTPTSALQRFLFRARSDGVVPQQSYPVMCGPAGLPQLDPQLFSVETMAEQPALRWHRPGLGTDELAARTFRRQLDLEWRRTSYSSLTAAAHGLAIAAVDVETTTRSDSGTPIDGAGLGVGSEPEVGREDDESAAVAALTELATTPRSAAAIDGDASMISPMTELPMGTQFGTVVHALLESVDPRADDLVGALTELAAAELDRGPTGPMTADQLGAGLAPALQTPLGPLAGGRRLCDIGTGDRLSELTFELPLAGGDEPRADVRLGDLIPLLTRHLGPRDPLHDYPDRLRLPLLADQALRGFLNGSIDAVLRIQGSVGMDSEAGAGAAPRYLVVDYKTNWLGDPDLGPLPVTNYTPDRMAQAMMSAHYPLQALLYAVALHRYLRWRQPGYDPEVHLGGVLYLFLRGMAGSRTPTVDGLPCGVFSWRPPSALIVELSDLLDGRL